MLRYLAASLVLIAAVPASASAALAGNANPRRLDFAAGPGEANRVTVTRSGDQLVIIDLGVSALGVEGTCTQDPAEPRRVFCPAADIVEYDVTGADLDDEFTIDTAFGGNLLAGAGNDVLRGGNGDDRLDGGPGQDTLDGGAGADQLFGATAQDPEAGTDSDRLAGGIGTDKLFGSGGTDVLDGGLGDDQLEAGGGDDDARGGDGADIVIGGGGNDRQDGGPGDDAVGTDVTLDVAQRPQDTGNDVLLGGPGRDTLVPGPGPPFADADAISGGEDFDTVSYALRTTPVAVSKDAADDDGDPVEHDNVALDVESLVGGAGNDTLRGGPGDDAIVGGAGDDNIDGLAGQDTLRGDGGAASGTDTVVGGDGNDRVEGEGGGDTVDGGAGRDAVSGGDGADRVSGGPGADELDGGAGTDAASYAAAGGATVQLDLGTGTSAQPGDTDRLVRLENVDGGDRQDTLIGTTDANTLTGESGEDYVDGGEGVDRLEGGASADVMASRDDAADEPISCGPGADLAIIDLRDRAVRSGPERCELVDDGTDRTPRAGRVVVAPPQGCTASQFALPGMHRRVPLRYDLLLPSGYKDRKAPTLEAGDCKLRLTVATAGPKRASASVSGDAAVALAQTPGRTLATVLTLKRPSCSAAGLRRRAPIRDAEVRVSTDKRPGRWSVKGRYSRGASLGTDWTTREGCRSTTTVVRRGRVRVYDLVKRRTVVVRAGERYIARARP